jgi:lysozyme family protein
MSTGPFPYEYTAGEMPSYTLPDGSHARMDEQVSPMSAPQRTRMEIMLIQRALGVPEDGIIGIETRMAVAVAADALKRQKEHL